MSTLILGISAYSRASAAALVGDGEIIAAAQEERFTRKPHDAAFPSNAIGYCLLEAQVALTDIDYIVVCEKPRAMSLPIRLKERWYLKALFKKELAVIAGRNGKSLSPLVFVESHQVCAAALAIWYEHFGNSRSAPSKSNSLDDAIHGGYLGPWFAPDSIAEYLDSIKAPYRKLDAIALIDEVSDRLVSEKLIGWFQGRMEFGPHTLGGRSIFCHPRSAKMQTLRKAKIESSEFAQPFASVIKAECESEWCAHDSSNPNRSSGVPVYADIDPLLYQLLDKFDQKTGCPALASTSFSVRDEPVVCTPADAYRGFMRTEMDCLVLENMILHKHEQPVWEEQQDW